MQGQRAKLTSVNLFSVPEVGAVSSKFTISTFGITNGTNGSSKNEQRPIKHPGIRRMHSTSYSRNLINLAF